MFFTDTGLAWVLRLLVLDLCFAAGFVFSLLRDEWRSSMRPWLLSTGQLLTH